MKKYICIIITILLLILIPFTNLSYAGDDEKEEATSGSSVIEDLGDLNNYHKIDDSGTTKVAEKAGVILEIITVIGMVLSIIMLIIIGIKYMLGSVEEKADYKKSMIPYLVGAILLFSGSILPSIIYNLVTQVSNKI